MTIHIDGVGKDANIVTNKAGGMQSKAIGRFDLIPTSVLRQFYNLTAAKDLYMRSLELMIDRMENGISTDNMLMEVMSMEPNFLEIISKVLEEGLEKYPRDNWRLISPEDHFNHALIHLYALIKGDTQDDHYAHFLTRIAMFAETDEDNYNFKEIAQ